MLNMMYRYFRASCTPVPAAEPVDQLPFLGRGVLPRHQDRLGAGHRVQHDQAVGRSVLPVETRSQIASATCKVGATSTDPLRTTTSASI